MKKAFLVIFAIGVAANVFGRSRDMQNAFDIMNLINRGISTVDHADRVTARHYYRMSRYYPQPMPVYAASTYGAPVVASAPVPVAAQPVIVQPVRMYPGRRPWHYQTPGHIPPQRGIVYAQ